jgi:exodeoxyribonuclease VII small subunit
MPRKKKDSAEEGSFEAALKELEGIVEQLEGGELPLEEAMARFERGIALCRQCRGTLDKVQKRIETLLEDSEGALRLEPMDAGDEEEGN